MEDTTRTKEKLDNVNAFYLVIDVETAPRRDFCPMQTEIIELGWATILNGLISEQASTLIKPAHKIPLDVTEALGITNEMVADAPDFIEAFQKVLMKVEKSSILVGHNVSYDINVIEEVAHRRLGLKAEDFLSGFNAMQVVDTKRLFAKLFPDESNRRLKDLMRVLEIEETEKRHRAGTDANYTALSLIKMFSVMSSRFGIDILEPGFLAHFIETGHPFYQRPLFLNR
ncbi:hypothetical protein A2982_03770 [candidate division WWE3 bacterium RIFCSPLOWO2_01_FULL_39_13]|uniref:Exonuclease domain-containing protein n=1 Tax=candidate division WWE3 bacterium RIFCSPLOWO2_01_FULL_39_13 TaxID=1802624 RepID=A0A1F4V402_UNCKA|nr:MAG: hypothetical protein A2982_03770 [candidate division WWE3 bacterium RIFCSPLOWO2_01_FULL_39_13]